MTERSVFKNKISLLNCSSEADETLSPLFLLKTKSCVSDGCHYLSWFWASLLETFFLHWNVCSVQPGSLSPHALCHMHRYSGRCGWVLHQQNLVARVRWQPSNARFKGDCQWIGTEEKESTVLSDGHKHWKSFGASLQFFSCSQTKYFFHSLFCDS